MGERADYWLTRWNEAAEILAAYHRIGRARIDRAQWLADWRVEHERPDQWSRAGLARLKASGRDANQDGDTCAKDREP